MIAPHSVNVQEAGREESMDRPLVALLRITLIKDRYTQNSFKRSEGR